MLLLAVLSEPVCRFRPQVPSSRLTTFVTRVANDEPASTTNDGKARQNQDAEAKRNGKPGAAMTTAAAEHG